MIALNRKNALFAGSDGGAEHWATVASLIETCKLNDIDPLAYLTDALTRIVNGHPNRDIDQLLPWAYRKQQYLVSKRLTVRRISARTASLCAQSSVPLATQSAH